MNKQTVDIFFWVGEISGDRLASKLIKKLKKKNPNIKIAGITGPRMRELGVINLGNMERLNRWHLLLLFISKPILYLLGYYVRWRALKLRPKVSIFVDAPTSSFMLAKHFKNAGYKGCYIKYVCPSFCWPDHGRRKRMESLFDVLISIVPNEKEMLKDANLSVHYIGHPIFEDRDIRQDNQILEVSNHSPRVTLFPGSRNWAVKRVLPAQLKSCKILAEKYPDMIIKISCATQSLKRIIEKIVRKQKFEFRNLEIIKTYDESSKNELMCQTDVAMAIPGTINLELASFQIPTLLAFPIPGWFRWIGLSVWKMGNPQSKYSLINVVSEDKIYPELLETPFTPENAAEILEDLLFNANLRSQIQQNCTSVCNIFKADTIDTDEAGIVMDYIQDWS